MPYDQMMTNENGQKLRKSAVQQSFVDLLTSPIFTFRLFVCLHGNISIYLHRMMF